MTNPIKEKTVCSVCLRHVESLNEACAFNGNCFHKECFVCDHCKKPLDKPFIKNGKLVCATHQVEVPPVADSLSNPPFGIPAKLRAEPETFQIANYNVYPAPALSIERGMPSTETVVATLVETGNMYEMREGFQASETKVIKEGGNFLVFTGLKINKMGRIKNELRQMQIVKYDMFFIRFRIGTHYWDSRKFKLVSSCTQLPKEIRSRVRPSKSAPVSTEDTSSKSSTSNGSTSSS